MRKYTRINVENYDLSRVQDAIGEALDPISTSPILDANFVKNISLKSGQDNQVEHGLNRPYQMWFLVRSNAAAHVYEAATQYLPSKFITLRCNTDVTVSLWVA